MSTSAYCMQRKVYHLLHAANVAAAVANGDQNRQNWYRVQNSYDTRSVGQDAFSFSC